MSARREPVPDYPREVQRKAQRAARARQNPRRGWRAIGQVGVLGWLFALPVALGAFFGRYLGRLLAEPRIALAGILLGVLAGGYAVWRQLRAIADEADDADEPPPGPEEGPPP